MKNVLLFLLSAFLFLLALLGVIPAAYAQHWLWGREGSGTGCEGWAVAVDALGDVYGGGMNQYATPVSFGSFTIPGYTNGDQYQSVWVKYDPTGTVLWAGATVSGATCLQNITTDPSGNLIIMGSFTSDTMQIGSFILINAYADGSAQYFLAKLNPDGTVLWAINDGVTVPEADIVDGMLGAGSVTTDAAGNIYITSAFKKTSITIGGHTLTNADGSGFSYDAFVAKYTPAGAVAWVTSIGGVNNDFPLGITVTNSGNVYIAGAFWSPSISVGGNVIHNPYGNSLAFIAKFSSSGGPLWAQSAGKSQAYAAGVTSDDSGDIYITGSFYDSVISFGRVTGNRIFARSTAPALFVAKYSSADTASWVNIIESQSYQVMGYSIAWSPCARQVWVSADIYGQTLLGASDTIMPSGIDPVLIAGYSSSGVVARYSTLTSGADDQTEITCGATGNVYLCSDFMEPVRIGPDSLTGIGSEETFYVAEYGNSITNTPDSTYVTRDTSAPCDTSGIILTASAGYPYYYWDNGSTGVTRAINTSGKYYVYCMTCTAIQVDTFNITVVADTLYHHTDTVACAPSDLFVLTLTAPTGTNYLWYDSTTAATHNENSPGTYWVSYMSGCNFITDTFNVTFTVSSPPCTMGVKNVATGSGEDVVFYPNPAKDELSIKTAIGAYHSFTVSNRIGQQWIQQPIDAPLTNVDVSMLPPGLYFITLRGDDGYKVLKFIKM